MHAFLIALAIAASHAPPQKKIIRLEAESGTLVGAKIATTRTGFSGKGYVTGFDKDGDKVVLKFKAVAGIYETTICYSTTSGTKAYVLNVNGSKMPEMFGDSEDKFATASLGKIELKTGANKIEIDKGAGGFDIDYVELAPAKIDKSLKKVPLTLADTHASPQTLAAFRRMAATYGTKTLSGQYSDEDTKYIVKNTKHTPAIYAADFKDYSPSRIPFSPIPKNLTEKVIQHGKAGQIVSLSWHWNAPSYLINSTIKDADGKDVDANWYKGFYTYATNFDLSQAIDDPNSANYKLIVRDIDAIAVQLKKLSDAHVTVLWRPLHEAEGGWFWWGAKGSQPFVKLWRLMFNQLTVVHKLHNLIWVFTIGSNPDWYPGDEYVDVLGVDTYPTDHSDTLETIWEGLKKQFDGKKMLAISEFGGVPDIPKMRRFGVEWAYFVSWSGQVQAPDTSKATLKRIYESPSVKNKAGL